MVLTGQCRAGKHGKLKLGFAGGREDDWEPDLVYTEA